MRRPAELSQRTKLSSAGTATGCSLDLVGVLAGVAVPEASLGALKVVLGALPVRAPLLVGRR